MDVLTLIAQLKKQVSTTGKIVLDNSILSAADQTQVQTVFGLTTSQFITINGISLSDIPDSSGNTLTIPAGTVDLLGLQSLPVKIIYSADTAIDITLDISLPADWTFKSSFPTLDFFPYDSLTLSASHFIYSSVDSKDYPLWSTQPADAIDLAAGLNFGSEISLAAISLLQTLLSAQFPDGTLKLWGPFSASTACSYPVLSLSADLNISSFALIPGLSLPDLSLTLEITDRNADSFQDFNFGITAKTQDMQYNCWITGNTQAISVSGNPRPSYSATLENLANSSLCSAILPAGTDFTAFIPAPLSDAFTSIELNGFSLVISLDGTKSVTWLQILIGEKPNAAIDLGLFTLTGLNLDVSWFDPAAEGSLAMVNISAEASIPVKVFTDPFDFAISISKTTDWVIDSVSAEYNGAISLSDIITELAPGVTIPSSLSDLSFTNFLLTADPSGSSYTCACKGNLDFDILSATVASDFYLFFNKNGSDHTVDLSGAFYVDRTSFLLNTSLTDSGDDSDFQFTATADQVPLSSFVETLFEDFDIDLSILPEIILTNLTVNYNTPTVGEVSVDASFTFDTNYTGNFYFTALKTGTPLKWEFVAVANLETKDPVDIGAQLPLIGSQISGDFELKDSYLIITSTAPTGITIAAKPDLTIPAGVSFVFDLVLAGQSQSLTLPIVSYSDPKTQSSTNNTPKKLTADTEDNSSSKPPATIDVQKKVGPVFIDSVSLTYADKVLACSLNASLALGPMDVSLDGFSFGSSIESFSPVFNLNGLGFAYASTGFAIEGAILKIPADQLQQDVSLQFDGTLLVQAEQWGLSALASFAQMTDGSSSLFVFVDINTTLGGPPFFIVEGLMGGFGYNRSLVIPSFDTVQNFPLLAIGGPQGGSSQDAAMQTLRILEGQDAGADGAKTQWIIPKEGDYWIAAGLKFSSFEIVQGELLLIAEFGTDLQFAILGLAWLSLPQGAGDSDTFVYVELQMAAVLKPADGFFSVAGSLTSNSFVLTKACHLTGGFAFNMWYGDNPNAGQFVMTVGGYHPAFTVPSYYPNVSRLAFTWQVSGDISVKGDSYFAITPSCGMAGGSLEALFQSGDIKAWFTAQANMLVTWNPFSFIAGISIEIGASVTIDLLVCHTTISVSLGASLDLWGPPLGGRVRVHIVIVTVTISFGSDDALNRNYEALDWKGFTPLLPANGDICKSVINSGLTRTVEKNTSAGKIRDSNKITADDSTGKLWVVRSGTFGFTTQSVIPSSELTYGTDSDYGKNITGTDAISIRPMNLPAVRSVHNLQISKDSADAPPIDVTDWSLIASQGNVAATLWGTPLTDSSGAFVQSPTMPGADTIDKQLTGFTVNSPAPRAGSSFGIMPLAELMEEYILPGIAKNPLSTNPVYNADYQPAVGENVIEDLATISTTALLNRNNLYTILSSNNIYTGNNDGMQAMAAAAGDLFTDQPMEQS